MYKGSVTLLATSCTVGELPSLSSLGLKGALMTIIIIPTLYMVYMQTLEVIQRNLSIVDSIKTQLAVLYREMSLNSEVDLYTALCGWDRRQCPHYRGVLYSDCPL